MTIEQWLGKDNVIGIDIWKKKYRFENETFEEWLDRVSGGDKQLRTLIQEKRFLPAGRILANRGLYKNGVKVTYSNCYVISPPEDNIESIMDCAKHLARTFSYGGGCGIDISKLSPRGAKVRNAAKTTSGAVSFMDLYSVVTSSICQLGRRGALMISIDCSHPDLEEFINVKSDLNKVTKANISIRITDEFMEAVKEDKDFELTYTRTETGESITNTINARKFFKKIAKMNWDYAEPGALFWDRIKSWSLLSNSSEFEFSGVNPCFSGDMLLLTENGYKSFNELCDTEPNLININGEIHKGKVWCNGEKDTIKLTFSDKSEIICTPDHRFMTLQGREILAKESKNKKIKPYINRTNNLNETYVKLGFIQGDGQLSRLSSEYHKGIEVNIGKKDADILDYFKNDKYSFKSHRAIYLNGYNDIMKKLKFSEQILPNRIFPETYDDWECNEKSSFLTGCYSANGCVVKKHRISYKTTCKQFAYKLKETLKNDFEIDSYITTNKAKNVKFDNGTYLCRESYDINISKYQSILKFNLLIGFLQIYKIKELEDLIISKLPYVRKIESFGKQKVYDFTEPKTHWGVVNGVIAHNCAEQPLPAGGSCLLGSINLSEFVTDAFTEYAIFDHEAFVECIRIAVRALNDVLDEGLPLHPLQEQRDSVRDWRQIGLGIFGLADMFIKLGIEYGSKESINLIDIIGTILVNESVKNSALLAKEFGAYPKCNIGEILYSDFFVKNIYDDIASLVEQYGLRNSQLLTIAPTGTISTMLQVSGGIEPIFANSYIRTTESVHNESVDYKIYTPIVEEYMNKFDIKNEKDLPEFFITSQELDYKQRIDLQSTWQKYIDASISSTVNVPEDFSIDDTEKLYIYAHEKGLKGVTIFRANCKRGAILTVDKEDSDENRSELKRGDIVQVFDDVIGKKRKLTTGCGSLHCSAFFDPITGDLLETYLSKGSSGGCNNFMIGLSRMISLAARSGCHISAIIDQLHSCGVCPSYAVRSAKRKDTSKGSCCPIAIANAIKDMHDEMKYELGIDEIYECTQPTNDATCPECGEKLIFEGGCNVCKACGWSKCS